VGRPGCGSGWWSQAPRACPVWRLLPRGGEHAPLGDDAGRGNPGVRRRPGDRGGHPGRPPVDAVRRARVDEVPAAGEGGLCGRLPRGRRRGGRAECGRDRFGGGAPGRGFSGAGGPAAVPVRTHGVRDAVERILLVGKPPPGAAVCGAAGYRWEVERARAVRLHRSTLTGGKRLMKRLTLWLLAAAVGLPSAIQAQGLTMQMSNGWKFSVSGNINAVAVYSANATVGAVNFNIRTGLLPGFAVFDAKGREGNYDLGVHVGFAPQIQNNGQVHDDLAQIDMRQLYLTVGFKG